MNTQHIIKLKLTCSAQNSKGYKPFINYLRCLIDEAISIPIIQDGPSDTSAHAATSLSTIATTDAPATAAVADVASPTTHKSPNQDNCTTAPTDSSAASDAAASATSDVAIVIDSNHAATITSDHNHASSITTAIANADDDHNTSADCVVVVPYSARPVKRNSNHLSDNKPTFLISNGGNVPASSAISSLSNSSNNNIVSHSGSHSGSNSHSHQHSNFLHDTSRQKRPKLEHDIGYDDIRDLSFTNEMSNESSSANNGIGSISKSSNKKPTDIDMAYNIFVRRVVDDTLDRTVTFCEQPKDIIGNLEEICAVAFPVMEKGRHRIKIRGYLKACRRNSKKHNGKVAMKDTPSHMCSEKAFQLAADALTRVNQELQVLKLARLGRSELVLPESNSQHSSDVGVCSKLEPLSSSVTTTAVTSSPLLPPLIQTATVTNTNTLSPNDLFCASVLPAAVFYPGLVPPPPLLAGPDCCPPRGCTPPPAHSAPPFPPAAAALAFPLLGLHCPAAASPSLLASNAAVLLEKMLYCHSIDPDFGSVLLRDSDATQEAISSMRAVARFLLNKSIMIESYLIREIQKSGYYFCPAEEM